MTRRAARNDRGAGAILVLAAVAVLGATGLVGVSVTRALIVRHEVAAAADLAALAAAEGRCRAAEPVAAANGVVVTRCLVEGETVRIDVARRVRWLGRETTVRSAARAGPGAEATECRALRAGQIRPFGGYPDSGVRGYLGR